MASSRASRAALHLDVTLAAAAVAELRRIVSDQVVVSRAASPDLRHELERAFPVIEAPVVRGRTVWEAVATGTSCIETPNWWGRRERLTTDRPFLVVDRKRGAVSERFVGEDVSPKWSARVRLLRTCLRSAAQLRGVRPAHGDPEAPWAVLLLPVAAERVAAHAGATGVPGVAALDPRVPELPGGLRLCVPDHAGSEWCAGVVASIVHEMERTGA